MVRALMQISGLTALSRILGFLRDILIARYLGTGVLGDAFFSAFRFPNLFRRIFGEGAFNAAFVPIFGKKLEKEGEGAALGFASNAFSLLFFSLFVLSIMAVIFMPQVMRVVVPGFLPKDTVVFSQLASHAISLDIDGKKSVYLRLKGGEKEATLTDLKVYPKLPVSSVQAIKELIGVNKRELGNPLALSIESVKGKGVHWENGVWHIPAECSELLIALPKEEGYVLLEGTLRAANTEANMYTCHPDTFRLTTRLSRITFFYLLCMALVAQLSGVLNTFKIFGTPAAAPILLNLAFLAGLGGFVATGFSKAPADVLAWSIAVAGVLQFALLYGACWRRGYAMRFVIPSWTPAMKRLLLLMGPGILAAGIQQINLLVGGIIASFKQGAISWIYYSDRVYQLPLGMIGISLGIVLLPEVTLRLRRGDREGASLSILKGVEIGLLLTLPAAIAFVVIPEAIIAVLFERGKFSALDTVQTAGALRAFAMGLPGYVLIKVLQPAYFARENTQSPMWMAAITVCVNIVCSLALFPFLSHIGIALATTIAAWVNVLLLVLGIKQHLIVRPLFWRKVFAISLSSLLMGGVLYVVWMAIGGSFVELLFFKKVLFLSLLVVVGMLSYGAFIWGLRASSLQELRTSFKR